MRKINVLGKLIEKESEGNWVNCALLQALRIIDIAGHYRGRLLSYEKPPIIEEKEAIYFEIIFENIIDYKSFTEVIAQEL